jgi:hypothetical protein
VLTEAFGSVLFIMGFDSDGYRNFVVRTSYLIMKLNPSACLFFRSGAFCTLFWVKSLFHFMERTHWGLSGQYPSCSHSYARAVFYADTFFCPCEICCRLGGAFGANAYMRISLPVLQHGQLSGVKL